MFSNNVHHVLVCTTSMYFMDVQYQTSARLAIQRANNGSDTKCWVAGVPT
jgi:hypothetical protein